MTHLQQRAADGLPTSATLSQPGAGQPVARLSRSPSFVTTLFPQSAPHRSPFSRQCTNRLKAPKTRPGAVS